MIKNIIDIQECDACNNKKGKLYYSLALCDNCLNQPLIKIINQSDAKNKYVLTNNDFKNVKYAKINNNKFFLINDIEAVAIKKYGSKEKAIQKINQKNKIKEKLIKERRIIEIERRYELTNHLSNIGLDDIKDLIDHSNQCWEYIKKGEDCGLNIKDIGINLLEENFYIKYTNYKKIIRKLRKDYRCYNSKKDVSSEAKEIALNKFIKDNINNQHKIIEIVPESLIDNVIHLIKEINNY